MKILITGAAGFIGSNLTKKLLDRGDRVFGIDNFVTGNQKNIDEHMRHSDFKFLEADIAKIDQNEKALLEEQNFDQIYHLACPTGVPNLVTLAEEMLATCSAGTRNILEIARAVGSNFLFTSSSEIYGDPLLAPQRESYTGNVDPAGVRSPYEEGKRFSESLISMYTRKFGVESRIVRVFNTYGPHMSETDERVIPKFIQQIRRGRALPVHGDGKQRRTFCHVDDLIAGLITIAEKGEKGEVYNLGSDREISILSLAQLINNILGKELEVQFVERPFHDHQARLPDLSKVRRLGWAPQIDLEDGLKLTLQLREPAKI